MKKIWLLGIILVFTIIPIAVILIIKLNRTNYSKLIINEDKWNSIIDSRKESTSIYFQNLEFNDYNLIIDNDNSTIYYSIVENSNNYNPSIKFNTNENVSIAINKEITNNLLDNSEELKIMIYNDNEYHIYKLVVTNYPIINITYDTNQNNKTKINVDIQLFDNHVNSPQRLVKSKGVLRIIEENNIYNISLIKESLGNNKRENHISIFGMEKRDDYIIKKEEDVSDDERYTQVFINNKYIGLFSLGPKEERRMNNYERNRENNK